MPPVSSDIGSARTMLAAIFCGTAIGLALIITFFGGAKGNYEDAAALGAQTTSVFAKVGRHPIHCQDGRDAAACIKGARDRKATSSVLWLGNSQLHAVNQFHQGEITATPLLFDSLVPRGLDLVTFSQPNASLQEHYVLFEYLRRQLPVRVLILPVVFDDFREEGLRDEVAALARDDPTAVGLSETEIGSRLVTDARSAPKDQETAGIAQTMQEQAERWLNGWLEAHSSLWQTRPAIRGEIFISLYKLRNTLFGIKATSKRKMIPGRYLANRSALAAILGAAEQNGIRVVLYVAPLRGGVETPYDTTEYSRFKAEVETLAKQHHATYSNLEALVPNELWGEKEATGLGEEAELDFMHFKAGGHQMLAAKLYLLVRDALTSREVTR